MRMFLIIDEKYSHLQGGLFERGKAGARAQGRDGKGSTLCSAPMPCRVRGGSGNSEAASSGFVPLRDESANSIGVRIPEQRQLGRER